MNDSIEESLRTFLERRSLRGPGKRWLALARERLDCTGHADQSRWRNATDAIPEGSEARLDHDTITVGDAATPPGVEDALRTLHPWRKGPFSVHGVFVDTEWRSDFKWHRIAEAIAPLKDALVLDIGCGNGYHVLRALGANARSVLGIDPSRLFYHQFRAIKRAGGLTEAPAWMLPMRDDELEVETGFDVVLSMGVLHHRRSPADHLEIVRRAVRPGGRALIETLVAPPPIENLLLPEDRYAKMRNVWFMPSPDILLRLMRRVGFKEPRIVDVSPTTVEEQRSTPWMTFESLQDFLDPHDPTKTVEGYPAPVRAAAIGYVE